MSSNNKEGEEKKDDKPSQQAVTQYVQNQSGNWIQLPLRSIPMKQILFHTDTWDRGMPANYHMDSTSPVLSKKKEE